MHVHMNLAGYGSGIYNSAQYYSGHGIGQGQYRRDLGNALRSSGASASAAASGNLQIAIAKCDLLTTFPFIAMYNI